MSSYELEYKQKLTTPKEAVKIVNSGDRVYVGTCTSIAYVLGNALADRADEIENVSVSCANVGKPLRLINNPNFQVVTYYMSAGERSAVRSGLLDYTSFHLSQLDVWCTQVAKPTVVFFEVAPMDENGYFNYGANGAVLNRHLLETAQKVVLQVNRCVPVCRGEYNQIHISDVDCIVEADEEILVRNDGEPNPNEAVAKIRDYLVDQIHDGDTFQLGAGHVPSSVAYALGEKNDLGVHTETVNDSMMKMMKSGVITNKYKKFYPGKSVAGFAMGTRELYDYIDHNDDFMFMPLTIVNDPYVMSQNDNFVSINSCLYVDLTGQVSSENINGIQYTGIGGQVDYVRGAQLSKGGRSYIAVESTYTNKKGERGSRIVFGIPAGTPVTTSRADVQYVVTEYGCVNLKTLTMRDRVKAMISLAHPDYRNELTAQAKQINLI